MKSNISYGCQVTDFGIDDWWDCFNGAKPYAAYDGAYKVRESMFDAPKE